MKTLTLHINDNIYDDIKKFLSLISSNKLKIEEHTSEAPNDSTLLTYNEFEKKWAGLLENSSLNKNWKDERAEYLYKKHM